MNRLIDLSAIALIAFGCATSTENDCPKPARPDDVFHQVSIVQLLATPGDYHHKYVIAVGVAEVRPDGQALFLHLEDFENGNIWNAVALQSDVAEYEHLNGKYASVKGCFHADMHGHLGMFEGTISEIERFVEMFDHQRHQPDEQS